jgi:ABC-type multidrug transport system permease subunit
MEERSFGAWILWGVLILAAALLSFLAFVIARSMKNG